MQPGKFSKIIIRISGLILFSTISINGAWAVYGCVVVCGIFHVNEPVCDVSRYRAGVYHHSIDAAGVQTFSSNTFRTLCACAIYNSCSAPVLISVQHHLARKNSSGTLLLASCHTIYHFLYLTRLGKPSWKKTFVTWLSWRRSCSLWHGPQCICTYVHVVILVGWACFGWRIKVSTGVRSVERCTSLRPLTKTNIHCKLESVTGHFHNFLGLRTC